MVQYPLGFGQWLQSLSYALSQPRKIAIVGELEAEDTQALLSLVRSGYQAFQVMALGAPSALLSRSCWEPGWGSRRRGGY